MNLKFAMNLQILEIFKRICELQLHLKSDLKSLLNNSKQSLRMQMKICFLGGRQSDSHSTTLHSFFMFVFQWEEGRGKQAVFCLSFIYPSPYKSFSCRPTIWCHPRWQECPPAHGKVNRAAMPQIFWLCSQVDPELNWCWSNGVECGHLEGTRGCLFE